MKRTSYGASLVRPKRRKMDWKQFVHDILTFRAHVWWAQFGVVVLTLVLLASLRTTVWFWPLIAILIFAVGSIVDISAHEWMHVSYIVALILIGAMLVVLHVGLLSIA